MRGLTITADSHLTTSEGVRMIAGQEHPVIAFYEGSMLIDVHGQSVLLNPTVLARNPFTVFITVDEVRREASYHYIEASEDHLTRLAWNVAQMEALEESVNEGDLACPRCERPISTWADDGEDETADHAACDACGWDADDVPLPQSAQRYMVCLDGGRPPKMWPNDELDEETALAAAKILRRRHPDSIVTLVLEQEEE